MTGPGDAALAGPSWKFWKASEDVKNEKSLEVPATSVPSGSCACLCMCVHRRVSKGTHASESAGREHPLCHLRPYLVPHRLGGCGCRGRRPLSGSGSLLWLWFSENEDRKEDWGSFSSPSMRTQEVRQKAIPVYWTVFGADMAKPLWGRSERQRSCWLLCEWIQRIPSSAGCRWRCFDCK